VDRNSGAVSSLAVATPKRTGRAAGFLAGLWPSEAIRARIIERVRRRKPAQTLPSTLVYRDIFILPTLFGTGFAILLVLTALGGLNFNNNLALLLVFVLGALAQATTLLAYRNLVGLVVVSVRGEPVFAGDPLHLRLVLDNPEDRHRFAVEATLATRASGDCQDVEPESGVQLDLSLPTRQRGWQDIPPLRLETRYPLAMFRAWSWIFPTARCLVYPRPAQDPPPLPSAGDGRSGRARKGRGDQVYGLRNYRPGDALKHIAWRTSARHDQLYTRQMETPREATCTLDYEALTGLDRERRLSVLVAWVLMAEHRQLDYALRLPGNALPAASGPEHRAACLEALALFDR
jgi:uncharacterized protein (DUF58 family)